MINNKCAYTEQNVKGRSIVRDAVMELDVLKSARCLRLRSQPNVRAGCVVVRSSSEPWPILSAGAGSTIQGKEPVCLSYHRPITLVSEIPWQKWEGHKPHYGMGTGIGQTTSLSRQFLAFGS